MSSQAGALPMSGFPVMELVDAVGQLHGLATAAHRQLLAFVAEIDRREAWRDDGATSIEGWLRWRLNLDLETAREWARVATALEELPAIARVYEAGQISWDQLRYLVRVATPDTDACIAEQAPGSSVGEIKAAARRAAIVHQLRERASERRYINWRLDGASGHLRISGRLAPEQGELVTAALTAIAERLPQDHGAWEPWGTRCADALAELASAKLSEESAGERAVLVVHTRSGSLAGDDESELGNGIPVSSETARRLGCDSSVQTVVHDAADRVVGIGRASRKVPPWLYRQLRRRDDGCRFPGCGRKRLVHAHHIEHWAKGGGTDLGNLALLCWHHHRLVHEGGWTVRGDPDESLTFVRPDGIVLGPGPPALRSEIRQRLLG